MPPLRRVGSAPAQVFPHLMLQNAAGARHSQALRNWKNKARNAKWETIKKRVKNVKSKLPKTRSARGSLVASEKARVQELRKLPNRIRNAKNENTRLRLLSRLFDLTKRQRAYNNARKAEKNEMTRREKEYNNRLASVGVYRGLRQFAPRK